MSSPSPLHSAARCGAELADSLASYQMKSLGCHAQNSLSFPDWPWLKEYVTTMGQGPCCPFHRVSRASYHPVMGCAWE